MAEDRAKNALIILIKSVKLAAKRGVYPILTDDLVSYSDAAMLALKTFDSSVVLPEHLANSKIPDQRESLETIKTLLGFAATNGAFELEEHSVISAALRIFVTPSPPQQNTAPKAQQQNAPPVPPAPKSSGKAPSGQDPVPEEPYVNESNEETPLLPKVV